MMNQVTRIQLKLQLAKMNDAFLEVFGSSSHKYILNTPLSIDVVKEFEAKYNITLPDGYRTFLTEIGNGGLEYQNSVVGNSGAGPYYGLFALGHPFHFIVENSFDNLHKEPFLTPETTPEQWDAIYLNMKDDISDEEYDEEVAKAYGGILNIGFCGCSEYLGIMLHGNDKGRVVNTYDEISYQPSFVEETNFLDWYENWLDKIISGKKIKESSLFTMESEESCIQGFVSRTEPYWKMVSLTYIRSFEQLSKHSIKVLWNAYASEENTNVKLFILNLLTKNDYRNVTEELVQLCTINPIAFLRNLHLYAKEKTIDWKTYIEQLKKANSDNIDIVNYITFISEVDLKH